MKARSITLLLGVSLVAGLAHSAPDGGGFDDPRIVNSEAFLRAHPDQRLRKSGMQAYQRRHFKDALEDFRTAARYADKTSQAMVAEMLWKGEGVARDRALAYAWMDLAAERSYPSLLAMRERYWSELDAAERARAVEVGQTVYAEYADDVAKPRLERELLTARNKATGSRLGHVGTLAIPGSTAGAKRVDEVTGLNNFKNFTDGSKYYAGEYWDAQQYWKWQDAQWRSLDKGSVVVGAPQGVGKMN